MAFFNPALLTLVREYRGLSQSQLAERAGFSQGYISKVESRSLEPSDVAVARLAETLDWPPAFFERGDRVYGFGTACMYHRKRAALTVHALREVQAKVNVVRLSLVPLLRDVVIDGNTTMPKLDVDEYDGDAARIAQLVRATWHLPLGPIESMVATVESAGALVYRVDFGTRLLDAVSHWSPDMPPLFFLSDAAPPDRLRFSLAHELGHVIMHGSPTRDMEREANEFAAEFLMPAREIGPGLRDIDLAKAAQLKAYWKVAMSALIRRARDLGFITPKRTSRLFMEMSSLGIRLSEPVELPVENPTLPGRILDLQQTEHGLTIDELVRAADLPDEFRIQHETVRPGLHAVK
jgi:Zn-dependent peptidase ImmA (M78 family)/transcriptional regulator with XRE-family HTH domain